MNPEGIPKIDDLPITFSILAEFRTNQDAGSFQNNSASDRRT